MMESGLTTSSEISYASAPFLRRFTLLYRIAIACGWLPMAAGITVFLLWLATDSGLFMVAGLFILLLGSLLFAIGIICLIIYAWREHRGRFASRKKILFRTAIAAAILVANFPIAFLI